MAMLDAKLQPWGVVQDQMNTIIKTTDPHDYSLVVPYGLQLVHTMRHPHVVKCLAFYHTTAGGTYVTHIDSGYTNEVYVWTMSSIDESDMKCVRFPIKAAVSKLIFVAQHRVFIGFCTDMTLHVFSDVIHRCADLSQTSCPATILCMTFIEDTDELITGGHGCLQAWKMTHVELREPLTPSRHIDCQITSEDWVRDVRVDKKLRQLVALCDEGVIIIDYTTNKQKLFIRNWHQTALTSCVFYRRLEYFITASMDGAIKVWNAVVFSQVHEFVGHYNCVTGLATHPTDPLLISSSKDGTIRVWRLDTFELTQRLDVGEKILGMRLAYSNQLYYYTLHDIKVWNFNLFHHIFTPIQSCVHKLARVKSPVTPSRILCAAEDGGVRLISAVTGAILTIIYPMATYQVLTDIVYDPKHESIYTVLATGDVLVYNTSSNPCQATQLWVPAALPDDCVLCLALIKLDCALGQKETEYSQSLIFAGHNNGQITLLEANRYFMKTPKQAHCGLVTGLEYSHGWYDVSSQKIGGADRLMSCGSDKRVRVWGIEMASASSVEIILVCLKTIVCDLGPTHVSMLGNVLCMVLPSKTVKMYHLLEDPCKSRRTSLGVGSVLGSSTTGHVIPCTHLKDHDHTQKITALCSCPSMRLFATTSDDGSVKIWDLTNTLVRELCFDQTLRSVCFANERGDLVVGFQNHISYVNLTTYLPLCSMEKAMQMDFVDEEKEEPVKFNPDLQLWFDLDSLPVYPAELVHRRQIQESVQIVSKYSMKVFKSMSMGIKEQQMMALERANRDVPDESSSSGASSDYAIESSLEGSESSERELNFILQEAKPHPATVAMEEVPPVDEDVDSGRGESPVQLELQEEVEDEDDRVLEEKEHVEEKKRNPYPIAPDGYIPNSVIRAIIGYKKPPTPPRSPWKLKPLPDGLSSPSRRSIAGSDVSYENHEPYMWATSEDDEEDFHVKDHSFEGRLSTIPGSVTPSQEADTDETKKKSRKLSHLPTLKKIDIPKWEEEEPSKKGKKKKRRQSKQINASELKSVRKHLAAAEADDDKDDVEDQEEENEDIPELLRRIARNDWFPKWVILNVENVTCALLDLLNKIADHQYRFVCEALVEIHKELEMDHTLAESVVAKLMSQLSSPRAVARANSIKTLASFGLCRKNIILSMLMPMADDDEAVRQEAMDAVSRLAGIKSRTGLVNYLETIGMLPQYQVQEREVIKELKDRYTNSPVHRPMIHHSLLNLLGKRGHQLRLQQRLQEEEEEEGDEMERLFPSDDELPIATPTDFIQMWICDNSKHIGVTRVPDEEDPIKTRKEIRQEQMRAKHMKKMSQQPDRPRRRPQRRALGEATPTADELEAEDDEALDQFEEPKRLSDVSMGQPQILSDRSLGSTDQSGSMGQSGSFGSTSTKSSDRRRTIHADMMEGRKAMLAKEKESLVAEMKEKLQKHRERYKQMMSHTRQPKVKTNLPNISNIFKYYAEREKLEAKREDISTETSSDVTLSDLSLSEKKENQKTVLTSEGIPSESGVGVSVYDSSCLFTDTETKTDKTGGMSSSGIITDQESLAQDATATRPKSSLTVENVQRFEAKSAKGRKKRKTKKKVKKELPDVRIKKEIKAPENWRDLYLQPLLEHSEKRHKDQSIGQRSKFAPIKCIPSDVKLVPGDTDERLVYTIALASKDGIEDEKPGLDIANNRDFGVTEFGKLQFTWTTQTTKEDATVMDSGDQMRTSMATSNMTKTSKNTNKEVQKLWLQQHLLFPSLYKMRALDENKRQCAMLRKLHKAAVHHKDPVKYQWDTPQPICLPPRPSNIDIMMEIKKSQPWKKHCKNDKRTPMGSKHYHLPYLQLSLPAPEPPIVPRNSTVSHHGTVLLPKLLNSDGQSVDDEMQSLSEETLAQ
ncbi:uncharacterized protein [Amphiura filiformis]|uniref:uncharacterized protein n=1 Tax=Amphiura filiformis TaxID=82378 RepID=UPI003B219CDA